MKVGLFSPWPPASTGVADYSAALVPYLQKLGQIEVNPATCDVAVYHLGNNSLHREIYERALSQPGVSVLHDAVLHHFYLGFGDRERYLDEFVHNYGDSHRTLGVELWTNR